MSVVTRRFAANPVRLSSDTWKSITALICQGDATAETEFSKVSGIASCLINDKMLAEVPLVMKNDGPRLRVYCLYGDDAIDGEQANEAKLTWKPTSGQWQVFLPCPADELDAYRAELTSRTSKFFVYDAQKGLDDEEKKKEEAQQTAAAVEVDWGAFKSL